MIRFISKLILSAIIILMAFSCYRIFMPNGDLDQNQILNKAYTLFKSVEKKSKEIRKEIQQLDVEDPLFLALPNQDDEQANSLISPPAESKDIIRNNIEVDDYNTLTSLDEKPAGSAISGNGFKFILSTLSELDSKLEIE